MHDGCEPLNNSFLNNGPGEPGPGCAPEKVIRLYGWHPSPMSLVHHLSKPLDMFVLGRACSSPCQPPRTSRPCGTPACRKPAQRALLARERDQPTPTHLRPRGLPCWASLNPRRALHPAASFPQCRESLPSPRPPVPATRRPARALAEGARVALLSVFPFRNVGAPTALTRCASRAMRCGRFRKTRVWPPWPTSTSCATRAVSSTLKRFQRNPQL